MYVVFKGCAISFHTSLFYPFSFLSAPHAENSVNTMLYGTSAQRFCASADSIFSCTHSPIRSFMHLHPSFLHSFLQILHSFTLIWLLHSSMLTFIHPCTELIHPLTPSYIDSFIASFIHSFIHSNFLPSFLHSFLPSFILSSIH
jgi:hypothetical protein